MFRVRVLAILALVCALCLAAEVPVQAAEIPDTLAGIGLGDTARQHHKRIRLRKARVVSGSPFVRRLPVTGDKYFSGGYVLVGTCAAPGRIVRIKMRYRDASLKFFRVLAGDLLRRYGEPAEYKGDFDGRTMGNKWAFTDTGDQSVSLILQRTEGGDPESDSGNTIKLTNWGLLEAERICWQEHHVPARKPARNPAMPAGQDNGYLPR